MSQYKLIRFIGVMALSVVWCTVELLVVAAIILFVLNQFRLNLGAFVWCFLTKFHMASTDSSIYIAILFYTLVYSILLLLIDRLLQRSFSDKEGSRRI